MKHSLFDIKKEGKKMIFKKLFLLISLFVALHAQANFEIKEQTGSYITFNSAQATKAWIGLYKKGTSNEWSNVLAWSWVTTAQTKISNISHLHEGDYQARLFFNNSFITEEAISFSIVEGPFQHQNRLQDREIATNKTKSFDIPYTGRNISPTDWVGIFKRGQSHTRENLLAWGYVTPIVFPVEDGKVTVRTMNGKNLPIDQYDMVYFAENSYISLGGISKLNVKSSFYVGYDQHRGLYDLKYTLQLYKYQNIAQEKDWVAMFKKEDTPTRENIVAWAYVNDGEILRDDPYYKFFYFSNFPTKNIDGNYKIVLFSNDSYNIIGETIIYNED